MSDEAGRAAFEAWVKTNRPRANIMYHTADGSCLPCVDAWECVVWQASRKQALEEVAALFPHKSAEYFGSTIQDEIEALK